MTYYEAQLEAESAFAQAGVPDADIDARLLLMHVSGLDSAGLLTERNSPISGDILDRYRRLAARRCRREPLQYILGTWEFMGLEFEVDPSCLIPRQDTELLVLKAYETCKALSRAFLREDCGMNDPSGNTSQGYDFRILDICTGSGCVVISLAKLILREMADEVQMGASNPLMKARAAVGISFEFEGTDISSDALKIASRNGARHGADIHFHRSDMFESIDHEGAAYDIITANPPYIETEEIKKLNPELWEYEPMLALDGGADGLVPYRVIAAEAGKHLKPDGVLLMEIGDTQGQQVKTLMERAGFGRVLIHRDLAGLDRVVECGRYNGAGSNRGR
ncbi:MAG: peptide chain release factor N(5)-glutamine methyltransferase [Lachnospiraceae bacterium]|nr:peptide chain release factor N(5)-glutamine methyltransferase [Lachnospiraceae bacterium]